MGIPNIDAAVNPKYLEQRDNSWQQFKDLLLPLSAVAAAGLLGYKGYKSLSKLPVSKLDMDKYMQTSDLAKKSIADALKSSDRDILYQLTKKLDSLRMP